jgi:hypothetical protein
MKARRTCKALSQAGSQRVTTTQSGPKSENLPSIQFSHSACLNRINTVYVHFLPFGPGKAEGARPEDFMDEEDIADIKKRQCILDASDEMNLSGTARLNRPQGADELESECV